MFSLISRNNNSELPKPLSFPLSYMVREHYLAMGELAVRLAPYAVRVEVIEDAILCQGITAMKLQHRLNLKILEDLPSNLQRLLFQHLKAPGGIEQGGVILDGVGRPQFSSEFLRKLCVHFRFLTSVVDCARTVSAADVKEGSLRTSVLEKLTLNSWERHVLAS